MRPSGSGHPVAHSSDAVAVHYGGALGDALWRGGSCEEVVIKEEQINSLFLVP